MKRGSRFLAVMLALASAGVTVGNSRVSALDYESVLNDNMNELQNCIVDYIFIKNYISGNIYLSEKYIEKLDYNSDGMVNILDSSRVKRKILELSAKENNPDVTTVSETTVTTVPVQETTVTSETTSAATSQVTTTNVVITTTDFSFKTGDYVYYSGDAHYSASGNGDKINVSGIFKIAGILADSVYPYTVQLENVGWVARKDVQPVTTAATTTTVPVTSTTQAVSVTTAPAVTTVPVTTTPAPTTTTSPAVSLKTGDTVAYSGNAHATASGNGKVVNVSGIFIIADILADATKPYTVQLQNTGWVSYKDLTGKNQPIVTTKPEGNQFDGNTYRIKNSSSGKYITVLGVSDKSNVCQSSLKSDLSQQFKVSSYFSDTTFRFVSLCSDKGKVLDIVRKGEEITDGCNVQLYDSVDPNAQTWKIESAGNGKYKILSAKNTKMALTVNGSEDGSLTGKGSDSAGNIYLSEFKNSENQLWILEKVN